jgi:hypothetical protein
MTVLLLIAPLFVLVLVAVLGFTGCTLDEQGTGPIVAPDLDPYGGAVAQNQPTAYWRLSDPPGSAQATDEIPPPDGDHPGTYHGNVALDQTPGLIQIDPLRPKAQFDGSGYVEVPHAGIFEAYYLAIEALVHPDMIGDTTRVIAGNMSSSDGWTLEIVPGSAIPDSDPSVDGWLQARARDGLGGEGAFDFELKLAELDTAWHVAMMIYDGTATLYKDGVEVASRDGLPYEPNRRDPLRIGVDFVGAIQEVAYYTGYALSAADIADHFKASRSQ